jgi:hypothetical protein
MKRRLNGTGHAFHCHPATAGVETRYRVKAAGGKPGRPLNDWGMGIHGRQTLLRLRWPQHAEIAA